MSQIILTKYLIYGNMHISDIFIEHFTVFYKKYLSAFRVKVMQHIEYFILFLHLSFFFSVYFQYCVHVYNRLASHTCWGSNMFPYGVSVTRAYN